MKIIKFNVQVKWKSILRRCFWLLWPWLASLASREPTTTFPSSHSHTSCGITSRQMYPVFHSVSKGKIILFVLVYMASGLHLAYLLGSHLEFRWVPKRQWVRQHYLRNGSINNRIHRKGKNIVNNLVSCDRNFVHGGRRVPPRNKKHLSQP